MGPPITRPAFPPLPPPVPLPLGACSPCAAPPGSISVAPLFVRLLVGAAGAVAAGTAAAGTVAAGVMSMAAVVVVPGAAVAEKVAEAVVVAAAPLVRRARGRARSAGVETACPESSTLVPK
jgi:hypothetical protein